MIRFRFLLVAVGFYSMPAVLTAQEIILESGVYQLAEEYYREAVDSYEEGKHSLAVIKFSRAIRLNPHNSDYFFGRASAQYSLGSYDSARADIETAMTLEPGQPDYHYRAGNVFFQFKQYNDAFDHYSLALQYQGANDVQINAKNCRYNRGVCGLYLEFYEEAVRDFTEVLLEDSEFFQALHNRGVAYKNLDNFEAACNDFAQAEAAGLAMSKNYIEKFCAGKYR